MQPKRDNELINKLKVQMQDENISEEMKQSIEELIRKYEYVTFNEWSDKKEFFSNAVSDMVNDFGFDEQHLAEAMANDHPTLQQTYMRLFKAFIKKMAQKAYFDGRNKSSVELAKAINEKMQDACLPCV